MSTTTPVPPAWAIPHQAKAAVLRAASVHSTSLKSAPSVKSAPSIRTGSYGAAPRPTTSQNMMVNNDPRSVEPIAQSMQQRASQPQIRATPSEITATIESPSWSTSDLPKTRTWPFKQCGPGCRARSLSVSSTITPYTETSVPSSVLRAVSQHSLPARRRDVSELSSRAGSAVSSANWDIHSEFYKAVRTGPTPWPAHIQTKDPEFSKTAPSPLLLYYYDETAPNDVLLGNDVRGEHPVRAGKVQLAKILTCQAGRIDEYPIGGDEYPGAYVLSLTPLSSSSSPMSGPSTASSTDSQVEGATEDPITWLKKAVGWRTEAPHRAEVCCTGESTSAASQSAHLPSRHISQGVLTNPSRHPSQSAPSPARQLSQNATGTAVQRGPESSITAAAAYSAEARAASDVRTASSPAQQKRKCCQADEVLSQPPNSDYTSTVRRGGAEVTSQPANSDYTSTVRPRKCCGADEVISQPANSDYTSTVRPRKCCGADEVISQPANSDCTSSSGTPVQRNRVASKLSAPVDTDAKVPSGGVAPKSGCCNMDEMSETSSYCSTCSSCSCTECRVAAEGLGETDTDVDSLGNADRRGNRAHDSSSRTTTITTSAPVHHYRETQKREADRDLGYFVRKLFFDVRDGPDAETDTTNEYNLCPTYSVSYKNYPVICYDSIVPATYSDFFRTRVPPLRQ